MANWSEVLREINQFGSSYDFLRRKYVQQLSELTGRNVICYYSGWLQRPELGFATAVNDNDKNGLMTTINGLDVTKGLDLILHTPGGDTAATESIVDYLWQKFQGDIRCFVPQMAMSAGTMIACSCKEIWMGKQSSLGPVDPQFNGIPAHGALEEFGKAYKEITTDPRTIPVWQPVIAKYSPTFLGECDKAVRWSTSLVKEWLARNMFRDVPNNDAIVNSIVSELIDHSLSLAHSRHLSNSKCKEMGLVIKELESDQALQDAILSVHHIYCHTLASTAAIKIIENNIGVAYIQIQQQQQLFIPQAGVVPSQANTSANQSEHNSRNDAAGIMADPNIKIIFDNLRNLGLCALVFGASMYFAKHTGTSDVRTYEILIAIFLFFAGVILGAINIAHGMSKLKNLPYSRVGQGAFIFLYAILAIELIRAVLALRAT